MSKQHNVRTKLSDLEFVEELSDVEVGAVAGGQAVLNPPETGIPDVDERLRKEFKNLSKRRAAAEGAFAKNNPELSKIVFGEDGPDSLR